MPPLHWWILCELGCMFPKNFFAGSAFQNELGKILPRCWNLLESFFVCNKKLSSSFVCRILKTLKSLPHFPLSWLEIRIYMKIYMKHIHIRKNIFQTFYSQWEISDRYINCMQLQPCNIYWSNCTHLCACTCCVDKIYIIWFIYHALIHLM